MDQAQQDDSTPGQAGKALLADKLNRSIVRMLREDGRRAYSEIAQALDVSEGTIRNRINSMKAAGALRIAAITDPQASEYRSEAMLGLKIGANCKPADVAAKLSKLDEIVYVAWMSGRYDLLVEVVSDGQGSLVHLLEKHIYDNPDIIDVEVMTRLRNYKNQFLLKKNWT